MVQFGIKEMKEFAESSDDPRVKALYKRMELSRAQSAKWCEENIKLKKLLFEIANNPAIDEARAVL